MLCLGLYIYIYIPGALGLEGKVRIERQWGAHLSQGGGGGTVHELNSRTTTSSIV